MTRLLLMGLALLAVAAMQERPRDDKYKDDAKAYCWNPRSSGSQVKQREQDPHGHKCACHLMCQIGADGGVIGDQEDKTCALWCTRELCRCHVEEPCEAHH